MEDRILGLSEMCKILNSSYPTVLALANRDDFPAFRIGKKWAVPYGKLMEWAAAQCEREQDGNA